MNETPAQKQDRTVLIALVCTFALAVFGIIFFALQSQHTEGRLLSTENMLTDARLQVEQPPGPAGTRPPLPLRAVLSAGAPADEPIHILHLINVGRERLTLGILVNQRPLGGAQGPVIGIAAGDVVEIPLRNLASGARIEIEAGDRYGPIELRVR